MAFQINSSELDSYLYGLDIDSKVLKTLKLLNVGDFITIRTPQSIHRYLEFHHFLVVRKKVYLYYGKTVRIFIGNILRINQVSRMLSGTDVKYIDTLPGINHLFLRDDNHELFKLPMSDVVKILNTPKFKIQLNIKKVKNKYVYYNGGES